MSKVYVEVLDLKVESRNGQNDRGSWSIHEQKAFLHTGEQYPAPITLTLPKDRAGSPWPEGKYELDLAESLYVGKYGKLQLGQLYLKPLPAAGAASRAA